MVAHHSPLRLARRMLCFHSGASPLKVIVHYHEIALKAGNRPFFIDKLARNLQRALSDLGSSRVERLSGRLLVETPPDAAEALVLDRISRVFGVANYAPALEVERDFRALVNAVVDAVREMPRASFRITTKRADKTFAKTSSEIDRDLGGAVQEATGWPVDLDDPGRTIRVEVLRDRILFSTEKRRGPGGFAVGSSGRVACLLSGGIDSPVAAWRLMKRGCRVVFIHFHAFPLLDRATIDKARLLARILTQYQFQSRLLLVPFGPIQQHIVASCAASLRVVLYRRFMVRIAERLARHRRVRALVTGESLGQVASQTLDNLSVIDEVARLPILRPLIGMDKDEIVREARAIGTFATSVLPDQDCCQLFVPRHPATAAKLEAVIQAESALDVADLVMSAVHGTEEERYAFP